MERGERSGEVKDESGLKDGYAYSPCPGISTLVSKDRKTCTTYYTDLNIIQSHVGFEYLQISTTIPFSLISTQAPVDRRSR